MFTAVAIVTAMTTAFTYARQPGNTLDSSTKKKTYRPGSAWTLSWPLGSHIDSTVDTVLYNYQRNFVPALVTDAWATTGQLSGPGLDMIYFGRPAAGTFFFNDAIEKWVPSFSKQKFYNVYIPMTLLSYNLTWDKQTKTDWLQAVFAGNVNRKIGIGAWVDFPYTLGSYAEQATKELAFGIQGYYTGSRYEMQAFYNHYDHTNKENGGITDDRYITDPGAVQGGVTSVQDKSIPVNLTNTHNTVKGSEFYMSHAYKLGFWRDITQETDTVKREEFVPVTKFVYSFRLLDNERFFINTTPPADGFWPHTYFDLSRTEDTARYWAVDNSFGIQMIEGFQKWARFGLSAYATWTVDRWWYRSLGSSELRESGMTPEEVAEAGLTPMPEGAEFNPLRTRNRLWIGGRLEKRRGKTIRYSADARFGILGDAAGEIDIKGSIVSRFRLGNDTVRIEADGFFKNLEPNYMYRHYYGNHYIWNNDFGKIRSFRAEGRLHIPWSWTTLSAGVENVQNHIYFNPQCLPVQHPGHIQIFSARLQQNLRFGIWNWDNTLTYQATSDSDILPLPAFTIYSNMYLHFKAFRALTVQMGVDSNYYTRCRGMMFQPATMAFHVQGDNPTYIGGYAFGNVYLTCKLYKVSFFVMCSHLNERWFSRDSFSLPHYPLNPREFRCGLSIDFAD